MRIRCGLLAGTSAVIAALVLTISGSLRAQASDPVALAGTASSNEEGAMEGVLVIARRAGAPFTVTVVTDSRGRYSFPRDVLQAGQYSLRIRAVGFELENPVTTTVDLQRGVTADLKLRTTRDLSSQLTSVEWIQSVPGSADQKRNLVQCGFCHTLERVVKSRYTAAQWLPVIQRMSTYYGDGTGLRRHQKNASRAGGEQALAPRPPSEQQKAMAEFLATINLSAADTWSYPLKPLPRPKGRATRVLVTEYDLPRTDTVPHDLDVDSRGNVWYGDAGWLFLGRLDPKTAAFNEYPVEGFMPNNPVGVLDVHFDKEDSLWVAMMNQGSKILKFDTRSMRPTFWDLPPDENGAYRRAAFVMPFHNDIDGRMWATDAGRTIYRLDARGGKVEAFNVFENLPGGNQGHMIYQVSADSQNNCYFLDAGGANIGRVDAKTGAVKLYPVPTPNSYPRRGILDSQDRFWFGEFRADRIGMFDTRTERFQEWTVPTPYTSPYFANADKNGDAWASGNQADRVLRLDPKTGEIIEYLMPGYTDSRKIAFDRSSSRVRFWMPNKNNATLIRVEPLD